MRASPGTVLVITCEEDVTANLVITQLNERGARVARVDPADIGPDLVLTAQIGAGQPGRWAGQLRTLSRHIALDDVRSIYHRRPSLWRFNGLEPQAREFAMAEARHGLKGLLASLPARRYVNHPTANERAEVKPAQLQAAVDAGFDVSATLITNEPDAVRAFAAEHGPIVYKSLRGVPSVPGGEVAAIWTQRIDPADVDESLAITAHLFQAEIPKTSDARVTVVANRVFAHEITTPDGALDWRSSDWAKLNHTTVQVPLDIQIAARRYLDTFGLVFGCFDFALQESPTGRRWTFVECNPNGQWGWLPDSDTIASAFADALLEGWAG
ncbi:ATP-grasp ribosomal peptide maturase [Nonomuraea longispora]|uniref:ATP-grasp ribosomal peptide maturase n=1 Tax=Nonomuraea longispora TaxID=1848320 RepID=A0A4R4NVJ5_9ACTN|nr:ATP-grasp ribosomal peptide maturase [Nonomuraea longispora]TDC11382.1 ATP-grasp ribosomal peptide maturase [Nonomuraea longispora]